MKLIKNNIFLFLILSSLFSMAESKRKPSSIDITSSQEIVFYAKETEPFSDFGKIQEFKGVLVQLNETDEQLANAQLYKFPNEEKSMMTQAICNGYADKIFGPEPTRTLRINKSLVLFDTPVGKACEYLLTDTYAHAKRRYAYVITGFIHGKLYSLVWAFYRLPTAEETSKLKTFWKTLK